MLVRRTIDCPQFIANDGSRLRELLHPKNDDVDLPYSIAVATVAPGERTYRHRLRQTEVYYLLEGGGRMCIGDETHVVVPGDVLLVPPDAEQWIENPGVNPLVFATLVSPPWRAEDDERLE